MRVLVVENGPAAQAIVALLRAQPNWTIDVATARRTVIDIFDPALHSIVVLDWQEPTEPSGRVLCHELRKSSARVGIVVTASRVATRDKLDAFAAGADHFLVTPCDPREIVAHVVALGRRLNASLSPTHAAGLALFSGIRHDSVLSSGVPELSERQREILVRLARGLGNKQIATALGCSVKNVEYHIGNLRRKAGCSTRSELVSWTWYRFGQELEVAGQHDEAPAPVPLSISSTVACKMPNAKSP